MKRINLLTGIFFMVWGALAAQSQGIVQSDRLFFTDATQTKLYTGEYKEFYDN